MKTSRFIWRIFLVPLVTMLCAFFVAPLQAQGQSVEAYVQMSADKSTLTFFYDTKRATRTGTTWCIEDKKEDNERQYPAWAGTYEAHDTTTTKAVFDDSFANFQPTSTAFWFRYFKALTAIEGLRNLNTQRVWNMRDMFLGCSALPSLELSNFNTSNVTDMSSMFAECAALTTLDLKNFNTSNVTDMRGIFAGCSTLTSLDLNKFNTQKVTDMSWMFAGCSALTTLNLKNFNTSNVTEMAGMFDGCSALTSLDLSSFNTSNVKYMGGMFENCSALTSLNLSSFNTSNVTGMVGMFAACSSLTSLDLSNFNTGKVTTMSDMFSACSALISLDLKNFNTSNVKSMAGMFQNCSALTSIDISNFNTKKVRYMKSMFADCSKLAYIVSNRAWNCEYSNDMFLGCTVLKGAVAYDASKVDVTMANPETGYFTKKLQDNPEVTSPEAYVNMNTNMTTLTFYYDKLRETRTGTTWGIEEKKEVNGWQYPAWVGTFYNPNRTTTKAIFDTSFKDFQPTNTEFWFQYLTALINIEGLQNLNTSEVTDMGGMFTGCSDLTTLDLSNFNTSEVTETAGMFSGCSALTTIDLKSFNTSKVTGMAGMFSGCSALTTIDLKSFNTSKVTGMAGMFSGCSALTTIDLKSFNTSNVTTMNNMFFGCRALISLDLRNFNTSNVTEMNGMFELCTALTSLDLSSFNTSKVIGMNGMFAGCAALTTLDLASFNTSKVTDMEYMFKNCSKLVNIVSNKAWQCEKSQEMFKGCTALKGVVAYNARKTDMKMANSETGYFTKKVQDKPEAYVQMSTDNTTLTFFYDNKRDTREGTTWDTTSPITTHCTTLLNAPAWGASEEKPNSTTTKVVFDASFAKFYPKTTASWFAHYSALKRIEGIENLNTSEVTSMKGMFTGCSALDTLDLTTFNTDKVNDMSEMFKNCANLSTVVCDKVWSTPHSEQMFYGCVKLLGKAAFDANKTSVEMANPNSGYFVATKPTALLSVFSLARTNGIYTLQGKRVRGNLQHLPAGVYIVNGKKVVVQ